MALKEGLQFLSLQLAFWVFVLDDNHLLLLLRTLALCALTQHLPSPPLRRAEEISLSSPWPQKVSLSLSLSLSLALSLVVES